MSICLPGPSNQPNIERSAEGIDQLVTFSSDPEAPDRMTVSFTLTDDEVALEPVEAYIARLTVESATSGVVVGEVDRTRINVLDDDSEHCVHKPNFIVCTGSTIFSLLILQVLFSCHNTPGYMYIYDISWTRIP